MTYPGPHPGTYPWANGHHFEPSADPMALGTALGRLAAHQERAIEIALAAHQEQQQIRIRLERLPEEIAARIPQAKPCPHPIAPAAATVPAAPTPPGARLKALAQGIRDLTAALAPIAVLGALLAGKLTSGDAMALAKHLLPGAGGSP